MELEKAITVRGKEIERLEGYDEILHDIRSLLEKAKYQAYKAVDNLRVQTYWQIGERIVRGELEHKERADYGSKIIENLAFDLKVDRRLLYRIVKFYRLYQIVVTVSPQLSWSHYEVLISIEDKNIRSFYEKQAIQNRWSIRELRNQIHSKLFERAKKKGKLVAITPLPLKEIEPEEVFKDTYNFEFLKLSESPTEYKLKTALLNKLEEFLRELGEDFFIGRREVPILIGDNYDKVDLELFHAGLLCYILVEVKTEKFKHYHVSQ
ncbi:MAG: PDDEXK nuclease domain-containing protein, partial [Candidatus Thermoplasmatota archaeon]